MSAPPVSIVLITGLSGSGKLTALRAFEDLGFEAVDNLPMRLVPALLPGLDPAAKAGPPARLAIGVDARTRDFDAAAMAPALADLQARAGGAARLIFLECDDDVLVRRFTETRRRHPLSEDRPAIDGIQRERTLMAPLRSLADQVIDTTLLAAADLKRRLTEEYGAPDAVMTVSLISFAYRNGLPREADLVFDARFLANPHWVPALRPRTGLDPEVGAHVAADPRFEPFLSGVTALLLSLFEAYRAEGKSYLTIAVGCTGGRHRSVYTVQRLAEALAAAGRRVTIAHRDAAR